MDVIADGMHTIFVPTEDAMLEAQPEVEGLLQDQEFLTEFLLQHMALGSIINYDKLECDTSLQMANGEINSFRCDDDEVLIGNDPRSMSKIVEKDELGCNFIIHSIDGLILPKVDSVNAKSKGNYGLGSAYNPCSICEIGETVTNFDSTVEFGDDEDKITCILADAMCRYGDCDKDTCEAFVDGKNNKCGCKEATTVDAVLAVDENHSTFLYVASHFPELFEKRFGDKDERITVFAPTNSAFESLTAFNNELIGIMLNDTEVWETHLLDLLNNHLLDDDNYAASKLVKEKELTAANDKELKFTENDNEDILVNKISKIVGAEIDAKNGYVHAVDELILPSWFETSILDVVKENDDLVNLFELIELAEVEDLLSGPGPFTLFAPTDDAISDALKDIPDTTSSGLKDAVASMLKNHVVRGIYPASAIEDGENLETEEGKDISTKKKDGKPSVEGKKITDEDILAYNGIVHLLDGVLFSSDLSDMLE